MADVKALLCGRGVLSLASCDNPQGAIRQPGVDLVGRTYDRE